MRLLLSTVGGAMMRMRLPALAAILITVACTGDAVPSAQPGGAFGPPGLDVPPISEARAKVIASALTTDVVAAELVWMKVSPMEGFLCMETYPMWRMTSGGGTVVYVTGDGQSKTTVDIDRLR